MQRNDGGMPALIHLSPLLGYALGFLFFFVIDVPTEFTFWGLREPSEEPINIAPVIGRIFLLFFSLVTPFMLWILFGERSPKNDRSGRVILNLQFSITLLYVAVVFVFSLGNYLLSFVGFSLPVIAPLVSHILIAGINICAVICGAFFSLAGRDVRYPGNLQILKLKEQ